MVRIHLLPGGKMPERKTAGAVGFDAAIRAVVSPSEMDPANPILRKTLFDFREIPKDNPYTERWIWFHRYKIIYPVGTCRLFN